MKEQVSQTKKGNVFRASMYVAVLIGLAGFLIFSILAAITFGNADLSLKDVYSVIVYKLFHIKSLSAYAEGAIHDVVWLIRLPRVLLALAVGMALSVCGVVMQAIVQNPLADPYVLGISSGASLGATLAIMLGIGSFLGGNSVGVTAFIGAMITSFAVIAIANMGGKATSAKLILAGMAVSAVCSAFSNFVIYITNDKNAATEVMKWSMGSLAGASWARVGVMLPVTLICVVIFWTQYRNLNPSGAPEPKAPARRWSWKRSTADRSWIPRLPKSCKMRGWCAFPTACASTSRRSDGSDGSGGLRTAPTCAPYMPRTRKGAARGRLLPNDRKPGVQSSPAASPRRPASRRR